MYDEFEDELEEIHDNGAQVIVVSNFDACIELEFSMYETYKVTDLEKIEIIAVVSLALPMNRDTTAKFSIMLWWKIKGTPTFPITSRVARSVLCIIASNSKLESKLLGCRAYANQEALRAEASDSERPFIYPTQPRLGVGL